MLIEAKDLFKRYPTGRVSVDALKGIDFFADEGEFVAVMGPSGSGKSTLLYILGCLVVHYLMFSLLVKKVFRR